MSLLRQNDRRDKQWQRFPTVVLSCLSTLLPAGEATCPFTWIVIVIATCTARRLCRGTLGKTDSDDGLQTSNYYTPVRDRHFYLL